MKNEPRISLIAQTSDGDELVDKGFSGQMGGICYMADAYSTLTSQPYDQHIKRATRAAKAGHHSIFEHVHYTFLLENIPKIAAMVLNSLECYVTSEKSSRYTEMSLGTDLERELYTKWQETFTKLITTRYPTETSNGLLNIDTLARENARYVTSVFTPTTLAYTISYRQAEYLVYWIDNLCNQMGNPLLAEQTFYINLLDSLMTIRNGIRKLITPLNLIPTVTTIPLLSTINEFSNVSPDELTHKDGDDWGDIDRQWRVSNPREYYGDVYITHYAASFAQLAQSIRHRTLHHTMSFIQPSTKLAEYTGAGIGAGIGKPGASGETEPRYYIPELIRGTKYEVEWLKDLWSVSTLFPQATLVYVTESGQMCDFIAKCNERLCSKAMLEIERQTEQTFLNLSMHYRNFSDGNKKILKQWTNSDGTPRQRGQSIGCPSPCKVGCKWARGRTV